MTFSVIIPVYNRKYLLERALDSLCKQKFKDFEVIVSDDGSTDDIKSIILQYESKLSIKYISNDNFGGPAKPRNNGIKIAKGNYIAFLDSDDWWCENKLSECYKILQLNRYNFIYHRLYYSPKRLFKSKLYSKKIKNSNLISHTLIYGNPIATSSVIIERNLILNVGYFSESKNEISIEDIIHWIKISMNNNSFYFLNKTLGYYNLDYNSLSHAFINLNLSKEKYLLKKYFSLLTKIEKLQALKSYEFKVARTNHTLKEFEKSRGLYKRLLFSRHFKGSKLKVTILILLTIFKISV